MEDQSSSLFELQVDESAQTYLRDTTKWTRFISITYYVLMGLMVFFLLIMLMFKDFVATAFSQNPTLSRFSTGTGMIIIIFAIIMFVAIAVFLLVTYQLMRFSTQTKKGIDQQNQDALEMGVGSLKTYMVISGILGIIGLLFGVIQLIAIL
ncbi:MAG: hypothetical protein V4539_05160 [Bacteroidota bacterium]